jgi:hypothetical protein
MNNEHDDALFIAAIAIVTLALTPWLLGVR